MGFCCGEDMCALLVNQPCNLKYLLLSCHLDIVGFHIGSNADVMGLEGNMSVM